MLVLALNIANCYCSDMVDERHLLFSQTVFILHVTSSYDVQANRLFMFCNKTGLK